METATARVISLLKPQNVCIPEDLKLEWSFEARTAVHVYEGILVLKETFYIWGRIVFMLWLNFLNSIFRFISCIVILDNEGKTKENWSRIKERI